MVTSNVRSRTVQGKGCQSGNHTDAGSHPGSISYWQSACHREGAQKKWGGGNQQTQQLSLGQVPEAVCHHPLSDRCTGTPGLDSSCWHRPECCSSPQGRWQSRHGSQVGRWWSRKEKIPPTCHWGRRRTEKPRVLWKPLEPPWGCKEWLRSERQSAGCVADENNLLS